MYKKSGNVAASARALDICNRTATRWMHAYKSKGKRVQHAGRHGRRKGDGRTLTLVQERRLMSMIVNKTPMQYKFRLALWNAKAIRELIRAEFGWDMPARTVRLYMRRNGFTPQRPKKRARGQGPAQVRRWLEHNYPRIRKDAKSVGAEIYWCHETGVSTGENIQRGYAPKGRTPLIAVTSVVSCRISMISAVSCRGALAFRLYTDSLNVRRFLRFARAVAHDSASAKIVLTVDNLSVHRARLMRSWAARHRKEIKIFYLPVYSPELNPDELGNSDLKLGVGQREPAADKEKLEWQMREHMKANKANPDKVRNFFPKSSVRYAAEYGHVMLPEQ